MSLFEIASGLELQTIEIKKTRAVLEEAQKYFDFIIEPDSTEAFYLAKNSRQVANLLCVVGDMLARVCNNSKTLIDELYEKIREQEG